MLKGRTVVESCAIQENTFLFKHIVDSIDPLVKVTAAALKDQSLRGLHTAKLIL